jgi:cytochrome c peroxidase
MEGERRTIGLWGGLAGKGWLHASATHHDVTDFATTIIQQRLGGTGLSEDDVHALAEYLARGIPAVQRPAVDAKLAEKGKTIFASRCVSCHRGDTYSSGNPDPQNEYGGGGESGPTLYDVGSATDWAHATLGEPFTNLFPPAAKDALSRLRGDRDLGASDPVQQTLMFEARPDRKRGQLKAPSLLNTWENVLYFHDGRADSLEEAVKDISKRTGTELSGDDLKAVVEYLKTL